MSSLHFFFFSIHTTISTDKETMHSEQENLFAQPAFRTNLNIFSLTLACVYVHMCKNESIKIHLSLEYAEH